MCVCVCVSTKAYVKICICKVGDCFWVFNTQKHAHISAYFITSKLSLTYNLWKTIFELDKWVKDSIIFIYQINSFYYNFFIFFILKQFYFIWVLYILIKEVEL